MLLAGGLPDRIVRRRDRKGSYHMGRYRSEPAYRARCIEANRRCRARKGLNRYAPTPCGECGRVIAKNNYKRHVATHRRGA